MVVTKTAGPCEATAVHPTTVHPTATVPSATTAAGRCIQRHAAHGNRRCG
jgi:hypothetical protein